MLQTAFCAYTCLSVRFKAVDIIKNRNFVLLLSLVIFGILLRFLFFPNNIYFGFDQARDAYISQEILQGELKIVGPTTSIVGLNHGAMFYYLFAPIYFLSQGDPTGLSVFIRIYNALGIVIIFFITKSLFKNLKQVNLTAIISAFLFAVSYEQTQYALYMTHPTFAVLTSMLFYLGLSMFLFNKNPLGLPLALLGAGLSFQFHFLQAVLFLVLIINLALFWRRIPRTGLRVILLSFLALIFSLSTFIIAEIRFRFQAINQFFSSASTHTSGSESSSFFNLQSGFNAALRFISDNLFAFSGLQFLVLILILLGSAFYLRNKDNRDQIIFLLIWLVVGLTSYLLLDSSLYFYAVGTSISLLILVAFLISQIFSKSIITGIIFLLVIVISNLYLIVLNNPKGPNKEINVQVGMLYADEKKVIDFIYDRAGGEPFSVNAFTMPIYINTTWDYLFNNYGRQKYGYVPIWGGRAAEGYPGFLTKNNARTTLPDKRFLIVEPTRDAVDHLGDFMTEEGYFTNNIEEISFGDIKVFVQEPK